MKTIHTLLIFLLILIMATASALADEPAFEYPEGTLYRGIYGYKEEIEYLQYQLFYGGYLGEDISEVDGIFGKKTEDAVKQFQKDHGIDVTGIVCPNTQNALDKDWENSMESQPLEDSPAFCVKGHYANGTEYEQLCEKHLSVYGTNALLINEANNDDETIAALQSGITYWLDDMDRLYALTIQKQPENAQLITNCKEAFKDYYRAKMSLWNAQYGAPSMAALEMGQQLLADHCVELCCGLMPQ